MSHLIESWAARLREAEAHREPIGPLRTASPSAPSPVNTTLIPASRTARLSRYLATPWPLNICVSECQTASANASPRSA